MTTTTPSDVRPPSDAEAIWLAETSLESMLIGAFKEPAQLRRHNQITGALASLHFGAYKSLDNQWVEDPQAVWLGYITSEAPGSGRELLQRIKALADEHDLLIVGEPILLRPKAWDSGRFAPLRNEDLHAWYQRQGFVLTATRTETRVWYPRTL